jgi:carbamoyl-phosphate synthase small subunit
MVKLAYLSLADGSVYEGTSFGSDNNSFGEVVFNTSMTGYQEMLTDPSYSGQILISTYPLIGNYGINPNDFESKKIQVRGFVVKEECQLPNHYQSKQTLHQYLQDAGIPGISGVDTRAITRKLRSGGVMTGVISSQMNPQKALELLKKQPDYGSIDFVRMVSTINPYEWSIESYDKPDYHVVVLDCGLKYNILRLLRQKGCRLTVVPCNTSYEEILKYNPDGILLSPGPGDPELLDYIVKTIQRLIEKKPIMGICLGCQLISRAFGGKTFKLKFGHRGGNHPVKELSSGRVYITAQNHGYAVDPDSLKNGLEITHINLNDGTVEGVAHKELPVFSVQYHSEDSPGPQDNRYLFNKFLEIIKTAKNNR